MGDDQGEIEGRIIPRLSTEYICFRTRTSSLCTSGYLYDFLKVGISSLVII